MATIANLAVSLTARIGNFEKGFKRATKIARRFGRDLGRHIKNIARMGAAITGVALGALTLMVKKQLSLIDSTTKTAEKLGLTTQALSGLQHAAELTGVPMTQLEMGIQRMTRRVAEAAQGMGEAQDALKTLGLDAANLASMSPDRQFMMIADAMEKVGSQSERVRLGFKLFDSEGVALINTLRGGSKQIQEYTKEAQELGFAFSEVDGSQVERANDAMTRAGRVVTGIARRIAIQLAPFIEIAANRFREFGMQGRNSGKIVVNSLNNVLEALGKMTDFFELLKAVWNSFVALVSGATVTLIQPARHFIKAWDRVLKFVGINVMDNLNQFFDDLSSGFADQTTEAADKASKAFERFNNGFHSKNAKVFFNELKADAKKAQDTVKELSVPSVSDSIEQKTKTGEFRQVDVSRIAVGGSRTPQDKPVNRQQGQTMITSLEKIARNTKMGQAVTT